jgi:hypothetical protein
MDNKHKEGFWQWESLILKCFGFERKMAKEKISQWITNQRLDIFAQRRFSVMGVLRKDLRLVKLAKIF